MGQSRPGHAARTALSSSSSNLRLAAERHALQRPPARTCCSQIARSKNQRARVVDKAIRARRPGTSAAMRLGAETTAGASGTRVAHAPKTPSPQSHGHVVGGSAKRWVVRRAWSAIVSSSWRLQPARPARMPGRKLAVVSCAADDSASLSYGSSRACNASSVGSPADSKSPVALRVPARARIAVSWCGRFPAGGRRFDEAPESLGSARRTSPYSSRVLHASPFGNPADSERVPWLCVARSRGGCHFASSSLSCTDQI